tara:strand:- start:167 stop:493 length:327 start_codon:yes stop_codon:yes gene_type:complete
MSSLEFSFTDQEFLSVINMIVKLDAPLGEEYIPLESMDERLDMGRLDSLSMIVFFVWLCHMFGIPESKLQDFIKKGNLTIQSIKEFVIAEFTQTCSMAEVEEYAKRCM